MNADKSTPLTQISWTTRVVHQWVRHRSADLTLAVVPVLIWLYIGYKDWIPLALTEVQPDARRASFQIIATLAGTMAGFTLTSVSILVNLLRTPMSAVDRLLPAADKKRVGSVFLLVLPNLTLSFILALIAILIDPAIEHGYWWIQALVALSVLSTLSALSRVVWVLHRLLALTSA